MRRLGLLLAYAVLASATAAGAEQRLILIGGGPRPSRALSRLVDWAGGTRARVLVITWAARDPGAALDSFRQDLAPFAPGQVEGAPTAPLSAEDKAVLREQLAWATAVYFTGGDQERILDTLRDRSLLEHMRARYQEGVVFAGTSAGTAVMSAIAIIGDGDRTVMNGDDVEVRPGIGLLPGVILDQHFIRRQRQNRLFGLVLKHPELIGLGVDEGTALIVRDNRTAEVVGASRVMVVEASRDGEAMSLQLLAPGETFDLKDKKKVARLTIRDTPGGCGSGRDAVDCEASAVAPR
jgi:cyanophycinase